MVDTRFVLPPWCGVSPPRTRRTARNRQDHTETAATPHGSDTPERHRRLDTLQQQATFPLWCVSPPKNCRIARNRQGHDGATAKPCCNAIHARRHRILDVLPRWHTLPSCPGVNSRGGSAVPQVRKHRRHEALSAVHQARAQARYSDAGVALPRDWWGRSVLKNGKYRRPPSNTSFTVRYS